MLRIRKYLGSAKSAGKRLKRVGNSRGKDKRTYRFLSGFRYRQQRPAGPKQDQELEKMEISISEH
jgi:hypothetical protein